MKKTWLHRLFSKNVPLEVVPLDSITPTDVEVSNACLSYRHDFGLLEPDEQRMVRFEATEWLHAWNKTLRLCTVKKTITTTKENQNANSGRQE